MLPEKFCIKDGKAYWHGQFMPSDSEDPCQIRRCWYGKEACETMECPDLDCPREQQMIPEGECCPICRPGTWLVVIGFILCSTLFARMALITANNIHY